MIVIANVVPSLSILSTLVMEAIRFSETSVLTSHTAYIPDDRILEVTEFVTLLMGIKGFPVRNTTGALYLLISGFREYLQLL
jgi:hypothetical protein